MRSGGASRIERWPGVRVPSVHDAEHQRPPGGSRCSPYKKTPASEPGSMAPCGERHPWRPPAREVKAAGNVKRNSEMAGVSIWCFGTSCPRSAFGSPEAPDDPGDSDRPSAGMSIPRGWSLARGSFQRRQGVRGCSDLKRAITGGTPPQSRALWAAKSANGVHDAYQENPARYRRPGARRRGGIRSNSAARPRWRLFVQVRTR